MDNNETYRIYFWNSRGFTYLDMSLNEIMHYFLLAYYTRFFNYKNDSFFIFLVGYLNFTHSVM